jgi:hypothetical protein
MTTENCMPRSRPIRNERTVQLTVPRGIPSNILSWELMRIRGNHYFRLAVSHEKEHKVGQPGVSGGAAGLEALARAPRLDLNNPQVISN